MARPDPATSSRRPPRRGSSSPLRLNLAAMVDVVFLLLIFFIFTNRWRTPEGSIATNLPVGAGRQVKAQREEPHPLPPIRIRLAGREDEVSIRCQDEPQADFDALALKLARLATIDPAVPVIIDAQPTVAFRFVVRALDAALKADLADVAFTAPSKEFVP